MLLPGDDLPKEDWLDAIHADKLVHIIFFAVLVYLFYQPFTNKKGKWLLVIVTSAFVYGVAIEFIQERWAVNRSFDIGDIAADATGCLLSCFYVILRRRINSNKR